MATTIITTTTAQDQRLATAVGDFLRLGRNATQAEVKALMIDYIRGIVQRYESRIAIQAVPAPSAFDPT